MINPEQNPENINSNLETLEGEVSLTEQEIENFRKLPKDDQERQKVKWLTKLKNLQRKLDQAIQEAIKSGGLEEAIKMKDRLEGEIKDFEKMVEVSEELIPTPEDEKIFEEIKRDNFDRVNDLTVITDEIAEILSGYSGEINLNGLSFISDSAAKALSKFRGQWLNLIGLKKISDTVAVNLAKIEGGLGLNGLESISDSAAQALAEHQNGFLSLSSLTSLSDKTAEYLGHCKSTVLNLNGLTSLSDTVAKYLAEYTGSFWIDNKTLQGKVTGYKKK